MRPCWCREYDASRELLVEAVVYGADRHMATDIFRNGNMPAHLKRRAKTPCSHFEFVSEVSACSSMVQSLSRQYLQAPTRPPCLCYADRRCWQ